MLLLGLPEVLGSLLHGLELGALLGSGLLLGLEDSGTLLLDLLLVALDDRAGDEAELVHLGDVDGLGGVLTLLVQPVLEKSSQFRFISSYWACACKVTHLGVGQLGPQLVLLLLAGELGVDAVDLVTELVDGSLKLVLLLVSLANELVLHVHGVLALGPGLLGGLVDTGGARGNRQVALADLLLDLAGLLGLLLAVGVHSLQKEVLVSRYQI